MDPENGSDYLLKKFSKSKKIVSPVVRQPNGKPADVDEGVAFVPVQIPEGDLQVVLQHRESPREFVEQFSPPLELAPGNLAVLGLRHIVGAYPPERLLESCFDDVGKVLHDTWIINGNLRGPPKCAAGRHIATVLRAPSALTDILRASMASFASTCR